MKSHPSRLLAISTLLSLLFGPPALLAEEEHSAQRQTIPGGQTLSMTKFYVGAAERLGTFPGKLVCLRCDLAHAPGGEAECKETGHRHALSMDDGVMIHPLLAGTEEQYVRLARERRRLGEASAQLDHAAQAGDWQRVRSHAQEAERMKKEVTSEAQVLTVGDVVYGPRMLQPDAQSLGLAGVVKSSTVNLERARRSLIEGLNQLAKLDGEWADFYQARIAYFEKIRVVGDDTEGPVLDPAHLKRRMQEAIQHEDFHEIQRLAEALAADPQRADGRIRVPSPVEEVLHQLAKPFPATVLEKATRIGLASEALAVEASLNSYLGCCCADRACFLSSPLAEEHPRAAGNTCGHACPPELPDALRANLDLLIRHPFITSAGTRYLPWFGEETLLVETFSEDAGESNASLLEALGLPRRQGLPRIRIEDALGRRG